MASRMKRNSRNLSLNVRKSSYVFEYRITFLGAEKVGKSAIINQFIEKEFLQHYQPTAEDHLTHVVEHRGNMCVCLLVDTAGSDDFPAMRKLSVSKGNAFIVVYSVANRKSFERAKKFIEEIKEVKRNNAEVKIVLVGNQNDLTKNREIDCSEALTYVDSLQGGNVVTDFVESSAKDYESVTEIVQKLLNMFIPPPPLIEVPVLNEKRKISFSQKFRASTRRAKGSLHRSKLSEDKSNESFSDSEVAPVTPMSPGSNRMLEKTFRSRADSTPVVKVPQRLLEPSYSSSPETSTPKHSRRLARRTSSPLHNTCIQEIGDPVLISHSLSLNRYAHPLQKARSNSNSSNDSGVSDDCHSPEFPPKFNSRRRASLPVTNTQNPYGINARRPSISEKMKGIFRKKSSSELM